LSLALALTVAVFVNAGPASTDAGKPQATIFFTTGAHLPISRVLSECEGKQLLERTYLGSNKEVRSESYSCANSLAPSLERREKSTNNQCGAHCTTICFKPSGGGPDPNDCQVIADALLFEGQNTGTPQVRTIYLTVPLRRFIPSASGNLFTIGPKVRLIFHRCLSD
jgi:hypothetical protein